MSEWKEWSADASARANAKVLNLIKAGGDEGASLKLIVDALGYKEIGAKSILGRLLKSGAIVKHKTLNHYFVNENPVSVIESVEKHVLGMPVAKGHWMDKVLAAFGLQRI